MTLALCEADHLEDSRAIPHSQGARPQTCIRAQRPQAPVGDLVDSWPATSHAGASRAR